MWRWARRIGVALVAVAALYFVGGSIGGAMVANWLLTPGNVDWSGAGQPSPTDPFELGYRGDPRQALGLEFEAITYMTELGEAEAWLIPAAAPSAKWAVYVYGIGGIRENGYRQLSILHEAGIPTLMITYRNDMGGKAPRGQPPFFGFGLSEWADLEAAIGWTLEQGAEEIVLVAESMGAAIAGQYLMRSETAGVVTALALDAPALDVPAIATGDANRFYLPFAGVLAGGALWTLAAAGPVRLADAVSLDEVADFPGPLFVAHGTTDQLVPFSITEQLVKMRTAPTTFLETSANHLLSFKENPARYREEMLGWLKSLGG